MRNRKKTTSRLARVRQDPVHNSVLISKIVNHIMKDGKKTVAAKQVYQALDLIAAKTKSDPLEYLKTALENIKPEMEVRSRRVGGANYQVPMPVRPERKQSLAIRWIVKAAADRPNKTYHTFGQKLAAEFIDAYSNQGEAIKKKLDTHKMAEANKAFSHFRW